MYKKLLFLMIAMPLTHSTVYSGEGQNDRKMDRFEANTHKAPEKALSQLVFSPCELMLGSGAMAATLICAKERSMDKEIVLPIMAASFMGLGVTKLGLITFGLCEQLTMNFSRISKFFNKLNSVSMPLGIITGLYWYSKAR